jgi:hypothetical protein
MTKTVLNSRTKENFKITVKSIYSTNPDTIFHSYWNCGYISVPIKDAKFIYSDRLLVHGGITYESYSEDKKFFVLGFDCAHYCDSKQFIKNPRSTGYCKNELIHLSKQIKRQIISSRKRSIKNAIKAIKGLKGLK